MKLFYKRPPQSVLIPKPESAQEIDKIFLGNISNTKKKWADVAVLALISIAYKQKGNGQAALAFVKSELERVKAAPEIMEAFERKEKLLNERSK